VDDLNFRAEFRRALDPMAPPAPWLAAAVLDGVRQRRLSWQPRRGLRRLTQPAWLLPAVAVLIAVAIVLTLIVGGHLLHFNQPVPVRPPTVRPLQQAPAGAPGCPGWSGPRDTQQWLWPTELASGGIAWAQGGLRTTDGGVHWRDVTPAALNAGNAGFYPPGYAELYLDGSHAWLAGVYGTATSCFDHIGVFGTRDGGKTWQQSSPVIVEVPAGYDVGGLQLGFFNGQVGWLWVQMESKKSVGLGDSTFTDSYLLSTSDAGLNWRVVSRISASIFQPHANPFCGGIVLFHLTFASPTVGWLAPGTVIGQSPPAPCDYPATVVTRDGGITWNPLSQPGYCDCWTGVPTFVDQLHGFWQIASSGSDSSLSLKSTSDGGLTWRNLPPPPAGDFILGIAPQDSQDLWALVAPPGWTKGPQNASPSTARWPIYHSSDGGETWKLVGGPTLSRGWIVLFADARHGMVVQVGGTVGSAETLLAVTSDGGRTWKIIKPSLQT
jgi:BNR/Asp-box repeat protein